MKLGFSKVRPRYGQGTIIRYCQIYLSLVGGVVVVAVGVMVVVVGGIVSFSEEWCLSVMEVEC